MRARLFLGNEVLRYVGAKNSQKVNWNWCLVDPVLSYSIVWKESEKRLLDIGSHLICERWNCASRRYVALLVKGSLRNVFVFAFGFHATVMSPARTQKNKCRF